MSTPSSCAMVDQALPFDVIATIMQLSRPRAILATMLTCRTLYHDAHAERLLLRDGVALSADRAVLSFARFMLASPARVRRLRALAVSRGGFSDAAVAALAALLAHPALALDTLALHDAGDVLASGLGTRIPVPLAPDHAAGCGTADSDLDPPPYPPQYPPLLGALVQLRTLQHLALSAPDRHGLALLSQLAAAAPLRTAHLALAVPGAEWGALGGDGDGGGGDARNPVVRLAGAARTLEALAGAGFDAGPDAVGSAAVFARVHTLRARYDPGGRAMPATALYASAFPNVGRFALMRERRRAGRRGEGRVGVGGWGVGVEDEDEDGDGDGDGDGDEDDDEDEDEVIMDPYVRRDLEERRERNRADQFEYGTWECLPVVEGTVVDVYALGLVCPVQELRLRGRVTAFTAVLLPDVLDDVQPETLSLAVVGARLFAEGGAVAELLMSPLVQCLRSLEMEICFLPAEGRDDVGSLLVSRLKFSFLRSAHSQRQHNLQATLVILPLRTLKLTLACGLLAPPEGQRRRPSCPALRFLEALDVNVYCGVFSAAMPSLEDVAVEISRDVRSREYLREQCRGVEGDFESDEDGEGVTNELAQLGFGGPQGDNDGRW
ncbi:hypothetical protein BD413DRAFT_680425 [Trametes elegans]|nr:hypothetical protein BD413DRAFT_680425 [Trametes elegans]